MFEIIPCGSIPKQSPDNSPDNYRPVSLLTILSKFLEYHVHNVIVDHLDETNLAVSGDSEQEDQQ